MGISLFGGGFFGGSQSSNASGSGIPFGQTQDRPANPDFGQPFFNADESRLELYSTTIGWQNIVQETPAVVSISGVYLEIDTSSTITINGTNFASGAIAYAVGTNGVEIQADTTTLVSVVQINATFSGLSKVHEPYDIKVVNPSNLYGILYETLQIDDLPVFITQSGTIGTYVEESPVSVQISATDEESSLTFSISSGSLPDGISLNSSTGLISGTPTNGIANTTYSFDVSVTDGNNIISRSFSITINDRGPVWQTAQNLPSFTKGSPYNQTVSAVDDSEIVSYSLVSGSLPDGLSINATSGVISGTPTSSSDAVFTIRATDSVSNQYSDRQFTMENTAPQIISQMNSLYYLVGEQFSAQVSISDDSTLTYSVTGTLPTGLSLNSVSGIVSGIPTVAGQSSTVTFTATDENGRSQTLNSITIQDLNANFMQVSGFSQQTFSAGSFSTFTVPTTGTYEFIVAGAQGGWALGTNSSYGGDGRIITFKTNLIAGTQLKYAVGNTVENSSGNSANGGGLGGGGSFLWIPAENNRLLAAAGGGGGGSITNGGSGTYHVGKDAQPLGVTSGSASQDGTAGGTNGGDGSAASGTPARGWNYLIANNFPSQGSNGYHGNGFPGPGSSSDHAGGGGSGYSGGGTSTYGANTGIGNSDGRNGGGGGGSYVTGGNRYAVDSGTNASQGYIIMKAATS